MAWLRFAILTAVALSLTTGAVVQVPPPPTLPEQSSISETLDLGPVDILPSPELVGGEQEKAGGRCQGFVGLSCDALRLLQSVEQALEVIPIAVASGVAGRGLTAVGLGGMTGIAPQSRSSRTVSISYPLSASGALGLTTGISSRAGTGPIIRHLTASHDEAMRAPLTVTRALDLLVQPRRLRARPSLQVPL